MDERSTRMSRRGFLRRSLALGGGVFAASLLAATVPSQVLAKTSESAPTPARTAARMAQVTTLTYWKSPHSEFEAERVAALIADFEAQNPDIVIDHTVTPWDTWDETYTTAFAGGSPPDVFYAPDMFWFKFAENGQLYDLSEFTDAPDYASEKAAWYANAWNLANYQGTQVAIPNIAIGFLVYYNVQMWQSLGLPFPPLSSYDALVTAAKAATSGDGETWGYLMTSTFADFAYFWSFQYFHDNGADFLNPTLDANGFNNAGGLTALTFISDLFCKHGVVPPAGLYNRQQLWDLFKGGKALMCMEESIQLSDLNAKPPSFTVDAFLQPGGSVQNTSFGNYGFYLMPATTTKAEAGWRWMRYLTDRNVLGPYADQHGFLIQRSDYIQYPDRPTSLDAKVAAIVAPKVQGFQVHANIREIIAAMWGEMEAALNCGVDPATALANAAARVDALA